MRSDERKKREKGRIRTIYIRMRPVSVSDAIFGGYRGLEVWEAKRLKALEQENTRLKKLLAESLRDKEALEVALRKKY